MGKQTTKGDVINNFVTPALAELVIFLVEPNAMRSLALNNYPNPLSRNAINRQTVEEVRR